MMLNSSHIDKLLITYTSPLILSQPIIIYLSRGTFGPTSNLLSLSSAILPLPLDLIKLYRPEVCFFPLLRNFQNPVMGDSSSSYIHLVQHLIEKCLVFHMSKEECIDALSKHANIKPVITTTVWNELEKENREFFEAYSQSRDKDDRMSEAETSALIQKMIAESSKDDTAD